MGLACLMLKTVDYDFTANGGLGHGCCPICVAPGRHAVVRGENMKREETNSIG